MKTNLANVIADYGCLSEEIYKKDYIKKVNKYLRKAIDSFEVEQGTIFIKFPKLKAKWKISKTERKILRRIYFQKVYPINWSIKKYHTYISILKKLTERFTQFFYTNLPKDSIVISEKKYVIYLLKAEEMLIKAEHAIEKQFFLACNWIQECAMIEQNMVRKHLITDDDKATTIVKDFLSDYEKGKTLMYSLEEKKNFIDNCFIYSGDSIFKLIIANASKAF
jgi:hypothetical protein